MIRVNSFKELNDFVGHFRFGLRGIPENLVLSFVVSEDGYEWSPFIPYEELKMKGYE